MKILVLGGTGFIGFNIVHHLIKQKYNVCILHRQNKLSGFLNDIKTENFPGDLNDSESLRIAMQDCQIVIHAAGYYPLYIVKPKQQLEQAQRQTENVIEAARKSKIKKIVYISSFATLGRPRNKFELVDENTPYDPADFTSLYHSIKYEMEQIVLAASGDFDVTVFIPTAVFGPYDHKPTTGRLIMDMMNGKLPAYVQGLMNILDVRDIAVSVEKAIHEDCTGRFILGNWNTNLADFLGMVAQIGNVKKPVIRTPVTLSYLSALLSEYFSYYLLRREKPFFPVTGLDLIKYGCHVSYKKAQEILQFSPSPITITIRDTIEWFRANNYVKK